MRSMCDNLMPWRHFDDREYNPYDDGSDSLILRNLPPSIASVHTTSRNEWKTLCLADYCYSDETIQLRDRLLRRATSCWYCSFCGHQATYPTILRHDCDLIKSSELTKLCWRIETHPERMWLVTHLLALVGMKDEDATEEVLDKKLDGQVFGCGLCVNERKGNGEMMSWRDAVSLLLPHFVVCLLTDSRFSNCFLLASDDTHDY